MIDWLNDNSGAVQAISVIAVAIVTGIYAWRTWSISSASEKQAEASARMAQATLHPVMTQWVDRRDLPRQQESVGFILQYQNIGNGPALNIRWLLQPTAGEWLDTAHRVGMGAHESGKARVKIKLPLSADGPPSVIAEYEDISKTRWRSTLNLIVEDGALGNGETTIERLSG